MSEYEQYISLQGVEKASDELIERVRSKGREVVIAKPGSSDYRYLEHVGAEGNVGNGDLKHILLRDNPSKAAVLEEFIHGVQYDVGIVQSSDNISWREYHAKDFLVRHQSLVGLSPEDVRILEQLRDRELRSETTQELRAQWFSDRGRSVEAETSRGLGAASLVVNAAEGNYAGAAMDAAGMAAEADAAQKAALQTGAKVLGREGAEVVAKHIPVVGAVVTAGFVVHEVGQHIRQGEWQVAGASLVAGAAESAGNFFGPLGIGDGAREAVRAGFVEVGGEKFEQVDNSSLRQLGESAVNVTTNLMAGPPTGQPLEAILPSNYRSITLGSDAMGDRSEVSRIAIERSGFSANDPRNNFMVLNGEVTLPRAHLLVLPDGTVQGPESGGVAFGNNPSIAAGVNGGTLGIMYAGTGAMNDAQYATVKSATEWLTSQRQREGIATPVEVIAGSLNTAQILQIPTPQGFTPGAVPTTGESTAAPVQRRAAVNGVSGP